MTAVTTEAIDRAERRCLERIEGLQRVLMARLDATAEALTIQAREYERRLSDLNHAHQRAVEAQSQTVSREAFDAYRDLQATTLEAAKREMQIWKDGVNAQLTVSVATAKTWSAAIGMLIVAISLAFQFLKS